MCNTDIADAAINEAIEKLLGKLGSMFSDDDQIIEKVAKLRASMNPVIITEK